VNAHEHDFVRIWRDGVVVDVRCRCGADPNVLLERRQVIADTFRPRDWLDEDVHPESLRGKALTYMDLLDGVDAVIARSLASMPWYRRWPLRAGMTGVRLWARFVDAIHRA
jgi:hypothetical protein